MTSKDLTIIIVTFKSDHKIVKCLRTIDSNFRVIIVENSKNYDFKKQIEKQFANVECIIAGENLGYARANNLALKNIKTKFSLILNPDTFLTKTTLDNFFIFLRKDLDFSILGPANVINKSNDKVTDLIEVNNIKGHAMFLNMNKFKDIGFFDENFFLYLEEIDLCERVKKNNGKIYLDKNITVEHQGGQSVNQTYALEVELARNWHWMWSTFYYSKKKNNFFIALIIILPKLFKACFKTLFYAIIFDKKLRLIYLYRLKGIFNSLINKPSWYRPNIK